MENKVESLEKKLEKPDWKQWLPVYGIAQIFKDGAARKPRVIDNEKLFWLSTAYQAVAINGIAFGVGYGLVKLMGD